MLKTRKETEIEAIQEGQGDLVEILEINMEDVDKDTISDGEKEDQSRSMIDNDIIEQTTKKEGKINPMDELMQMLIKMGEENGKIKKS